MNRFARSVIIDSGPLLALISKNARIHDWAVEQWRQIEPPVFICEAVISETTFLLKREGYGADKLFAFLESGIFKLDFAVKDNLRDIRILMERYRNLPMAFADACIVRMCELYPTAVVFTLDRDFFVYRKHGNRVIPLIIPDEN